MVIKNKLIYILRETFVFLNPFQMVHVEIWTSTYFCIYFLINEKNLSRPIRRKHYPTEITMSTREPYTCEYRVRVFV